MPEFYTLVSWVDPNGKLHVQSLNVIAPTHERAISTGQLAAEFQAPPGATDVNVSAIDVNDLPSWAR